MTVTIDKNIDSKVMLMFTGLALGSAAAHPAAEQHVLLQRCYIHLVMLSITT